MAPDERAMNSPLLLDTCTAIWLAEAESLALEATMVFEEAYDAGTGVYVSPITAWEIGLLNSRGRLALLIKPQLWLQRLLEVLKFRLADMSPQLLIASSFLPGTPPRDPADRIIATTAREYGYMLVTRDRLLLDYAAQGHIQALGC
jgi:PIN domain nuclease of toxin-antitoxin system